MKEFMLLAAAAITVFATDSAEARNARQNIVVQSYKDVMDNNMFEPGFNSAGYDAHMKAKAKQEDTEPVIAVSDPNEKPKDYNKEMADSLFAAPDLSPLIIEIVEKQNQVKVNIGQPLQIVLTEDGAAKWHCEKNLKHIEITEDYAFQGQRILNAVVKDKGKEKIYFDLIDDSNGTITVIESRILNITAR